MTIGKVSIRPASRYLSTDGGKISGSYPDALDIVNYISDINNPEDSYYAWDLFSSRTSYMRSMLKGTETGDRFIQYFRPAVAKQFEDVGFDVDRGKLPTERLCTLVQF